MRHSDDLTDDVLNGLITALLGFAVSMLALISAFALVAVVVYNGWLALLGVIIAGLIFYGIGRLVIKVLKL